MLPPAPTLPPVPGRDNVATPPDPPVPGVFGLVPEPHPMATIVAIIKHALLIMVTSN
jgi:hypothetical protein